MSRALLDGSPEDRAAAIAALAARAAAPDADELDALRACLGDPSKLVQRRAAEGFAALAAHGADVERRLHAVLGGEPLRLRWGAAYALALMGRLPIQALPTLLEAMGLDDGDLRWAAADLVKRLAGTDRPRVVAPLLAAASRQGGHRKMALYCLRDLEVEEAAPVALAAVDDENVETRLAALALLAKVHPEPAAAARRIVELIADPDPRMQRAAAATVGGLGVRSEDVIGALRRAEASDDAALRRAAARSLAALR